MPVQHCPTGVQECDWSLFLRANEGEKKKKKESNEPVGFPFFFEFTEDLPRGPETLRWRKKQTHFLLDGLRLNHVFSLDPPCIYAQERKRKERKESRLDKEKPSDTPSYHLSLSPAGPRHSGAEELGEPAYIHAGAFGREGQGNYMIHCRAFSWAIAPRGGAIHGCMSAALSYSPAR